MRLLLRYAFFGLDCILSAVLNTRVFVGVTEILEMLETYHKMLRVAMLLQR